MGEALKAHLGVLGDEVEATTIPSDCKQTAAWCIDQMPTLYAKFRETNESRYGDEITRLFQALLKELTRSTTVCPDATTLAAGIPDRVQLLHEQLGLPRLALKSPAVSLPRPRKAR